MLNERIDPNSIVGSGRVTRYLFAALSTSFVGAGLVRFAYTPLLPVLGVIAESVLKRTLSGIEEC